MEKMPKSLKHGGFGNGGGPGRGGSGNGVGPGRGIGDQAKPPVWIQISTGVVVIVLESDPVQLVVSCTVRESLLSSVICISVKVWVIDPDVTIVVGSTGNGQTRVVLDEDVVIVTVDMPEYGING